MVRVAVQYPLEVEVGQARARHTDQHPLTFDAHHFRGDGGGGREGASRGFFFAGTGAGASTAGAGASTAGAGASAVIGAGASGAGAGASAAAGAGSQFGCTFSLFRRLPSFLARRSASVLRRASERRLFWRSA